MTNELQEHGEVKIPPKLDKRTTLELISRIERGWIPNLFLRKNIEAAYDVLLEETKLLKAYLDRTRAANVLAPENIANKLQADSDQIKKEAMASRNELEVEKRAHENRERLDEFEQMRIKADIAEQELRLKRARDALNETAQTKSERVEKNLREAQKERDLRAKYNIERIVKEAKTKLDLSRELRSAAFELEAAILNQGIARAAIAGIDVNTEDFDAMDYLTNEEHLELQNIADTFQREIDGL